MQKKRILISFVLVFAAAITVFLSNTINSKIEIKPNDDIIPQQLWGARTGIDPALGNNSLITIKEDIFNNNLIYYYDMDKEKERVFCTRPNCRHNDKNCIAFFPHQAGLTNVIEAFQVGRYVYCIALGNTEGDWETNIKNAEFQVLKLDPYENTKTIVTKFKSVLSANIGDYSEYVDYINDIRYYNGCLWCTLNMASMDETGMTNTTRTASCCINIETGQAYCFNDIVLWCSDNLENTLYAKSSFIDEIMSKEEFDQNKPVIIDGYSWSDYQSYLSYSSSHTARTHTIVSQINLLTGDYSNRTILEYDSIPIYANDEFQYYFDNIYKLGMRDNWLYYQEFIPENNNQYNIDHSMLKRINLDTLEIENIYEIKNGSPLSIAQGHKVDLLLSDGYLFFADNKTDKNADIMAYNCNTNRVDFLFTDDRAITFRIYGVMDDGYVGKLSYRQDYDEFFWISAENLKSGNLKNVRKFKW